MEPWEQAWDRVPWLDIDDTKGIFRAGFEAARADGVLLTEAEARTVLAIVKAWQGTSIPGRWVTSAEQAEALRARLEARGAREG